MSENIKSYWWQAKNFGDTLTPFLVEYFTGRKVELVNRGDREKLLAVGSILHLVKEGDVVWGTGLNRRMKIDAPTGSKFLSVRGPLTRGMINGDVPEIYGDPAILLPLIYNPVVEKKFDIGYLPHYVDKPFVKVANGEVKINIQDDWKTVINGILSCKKIISSSLHGIIAAEAYGIPVVWKKYSDKITGGSLKYQDYFLGTGRGEQKYDQETEPPTNTEQRQMILIEVLKKHYDTN